MANKDIQKKMEKELSRFTVETVNQVTDEIENYQNKNNLSWLRVYDEVLKKLNLEKELNNNMLKIRVIREISVRGYDINTNPFSLERYR